MGNALTLRALRADVANDVDDTAVVAYGGSVTRTIAAKLGDVLNPKDYGAIGDGNSHPLSAGYGSLIAAQNVYPHATDLTDELDWAAGQAAINAAKLRGATAAGLYKGGIVRWTAGAYLSNRPYLLPRTGSGLTPVVHLDGENELTTMLVGFSGAGAAAFPSNRGMVEWDAATLAVWHNSISNIGFRLPLVDGVRAIWHKVNRGGGLATLGDVVAEWFQCNLRRLYIEANNDYHHTLIDLEVGNRFADMWDITADPNPGFTTTANKGYATNYDTLLLKTAYQYGGGDALHNEDSVGLGCCEVRNLKPGILQGGWTKAFEGRLYNTRFDTCQCNGPMPGRASAYIYAFLACDSSNISNLASEGGGGTHQYWFRNCHEIKGTNINAPVGAPRLQPVWQASHAYALGDRVIPTLLANPAASIAPRNRAYTATTAGTSGATEPAWADTGTTTSGGAVFTASAGTAVADGVYIEASEGVSLSGHSDNPASALPSQYLTRAVTIDATSRGCHLTDWTLRANVFSDAADQTALAAGVQVAILAPPNNDNYVSGSVVASFGNKRVPYRVGVDASTLDAIATDNGDANLFGSPTDFNNVSFWAKVNATVTVDAVVDPLGTSRADKLVENTANAAHYVHQTFTRGFTARQQTFSVYLKSAERTVSHLYVTDGVGGWRLVCDLAAGTATPQVIAAEAGMTNDGSGSTDVGNGWRRYWITMTMPAATSYTQVYVTVGDLFGYVGDGSSGVYAFGAQLENGAAATALSEVDRTFVFGIDSPAWRFPSTQTKNRTMTLSSTGAFAGAHFEFSRQDTGPFTFTVAGIGTLPAGTKGTISARHDGTAWLPRDYTPDFSTVIAGLGTASTKTAGNAVGNVPMVEAGGLLNASIIPAGGGGHQTWVVTNQAGMLALSSAIVGDYAIQTGSSPPNQQFYLNALPASTLGNWIGPISGVSVTSVNTQTGAVVLTTSDITEGSRLYYTDARVLAVAAPVVHNHDSRYYLKAEVDTSLGLKANTTDVVPNTRTLTTTAPLTGGHDFSTNFNLGVNAATTTSTGVAELATQAEADAHTDNVRAVTPLALAGHVLQTGLTTALALKPNLAGPNTFTGAHTWTVTAGNPITFDGNTGDVVIDNTGQISATLFSGTFSGAGPSLTNLNATELLSGTVPAARLPLVTTSVTGAMSAADKSKLDSIPSSLVGVVSAGTVTTSYTPDANTGEDFEITLGAATVTMNAPTNPTNGKVMKFWFKQDATGSRAVSWNAAYKFTTDIPSFTLSTAANAWDVIGVQYQSTLAKWVVVAAQHIGV